MAVYPCDYGRHRYPQPQQSMYFTQALNASADTYKMRMCPKHFREVLVMVTEAMAEIDDDSAVADHCESCQGEKVAALYAKVFPAKEEMRQFAVDLCAACLSALGNNLRIYNGTHMTGS